MHKEATFGKVNECDEGTLRSGMAIEITSPQIFGVASFLHIYAQNVIHKVGCYILLLISFYMTLMCNTSMDMNLSVGIWLQYDMQTFMIRLISKLYQKYVQI